MTEETTKHGWTEAERESFKNMLKMAAVIFLVVLIAVIVMSLLVPHVGGTGENLRPV
jgi:hypothetical protein